MGNLAILKHTFNLSDDVVCAQWVENPYYQYFCGEEFFQHALPLDRSSITRWRNRIGEERLEALLRREFRAGRAPAGGGQRSQPPVVEDQKLDTGETLEEAHIPAIAACQCSDRL